MCYGTVITVYKLIKKFIYVLLISSSSKTWQNTKLILLWCKIPILSLPCVFQITCTYLILKQVQRERIAETIQGQFLVVYSGHIPCDHILLIQILQPHVIFTLCLSAKPEVSWEFSVFLFTTFCSMLPTGFNGNCIEWDLSMLCPMTVHNISPRCALILVGSILPGIWE